MSEPQELSQVVEQFEALETIQVHLSTLEGAALDLSQKMVTDQEDALRRTIDRLPTEAVSDIQEGLDAHLTKLIGYRSAQEALESVHEPVPDAIAEAVARLEGELETNPQMRLAQFINGTGNYAVRFAAPEVI